MGDLIVSEFVSLNGVIEANARDVTLSRAPGTLAERSSSSRRRPDRRQ